MHKKNTIVLIPAYEPTEAVIDLTESLIEQGYGVVVVNDGSGKEYRPIFDTLSQRVVLIEHEQNLGKGHALKTGLSYIRDYDSDAGVITADADGQHKLDDIIHVGDVMLETPGTLVLGSRDFEGSIPFKSKFGNTLTRWVFGAISGVKVRDTQTGLRAFSADLIDEFVTLKGERYEYEINMLLWAAQQKIPIEEVPIKTVYIDDNSASNFDPIKDSVRIYSSILKFSFASFASFLIDFAALFLFREIFAFLPQATALLYAAICARAISSFCNFLMNKKIVFQSKESFWVALGKYYMLVVLILSANFGLLYLLNILIGVPLWISKIGTEILLFVLSYLVQKKHIFKHKEEKLL